MAKAKYGRSDTFHELLCNPRVYKTWDPNDEIWAKLAWLYEQNRQNGSSEEELNNG